MNTVKAADSEREWGNLSSMAFAMKSALGAWATAIGWDSVITASADLQEVETATFATAHKIPVVLRPSTREQVQECLRIANRLRIPVYPVSSGKNWGYGSRVPAADQSALLDLSRLNRIVDFNEDLAYVTVEPGVTQRQLYEFLQSRNSRLWMDATGSSPDCSLIGNTMERGFGHTPYGDHFSHVCGFEVLLPTGEFIETGFGRFQGAIATPVARWGIGPSLDGLFSQSNLGIVTRMTLWLMPAPEYFQAFYFRGDSYGSLGEIVDALRPLRLNGTLRSAVHIGNDFKVLSAIRQYPWEESRGRTPLPEPVMGEMRRQLNFGHWNGSGGLYGTKAQVAEARRLVRSALAGKVSKLQFLDDRAIRLASRFSKPFRLLTGWDLSRTLELVKPVYGLMKGIPTEFSLRSAYWRKRTTVPAQMDPDRDGCGLVWCAPIAPLAGDHAATMARLATDALLAHGFEPMLSFTLITERTLGCVVSVSYDRSVQGEDQRAMACHDDLITRMTEAGYYSYRLGIQSMGQMRRPSAYNEVLQTIKNALDPNNVLAPGRYQAAAAVAKSQSQKAGS